MIRSRVFCIIVVVRAPGKSAPPFELYQNRFLTSPSPTESKADPVSKIGQKILGALREFGDVLESGDPLERHFTVRSYAMLPQPTQYDGPAVRAVREQFAMSQGVFARFLCVSSATIQSWEQGRRVPSPIARRLLDEMSTCPEHFRARFADLASPRSGRAIPTATSPRSARSDLRKKPTVKKTRGKAV
jgi:DNA-binding transcriptional regulator YiaG